MNSPIRPVLRDGTCEAVESFRASRIPGAISRKIRLRDGTSHATTFCMPGPRGQSPSEMANAADRAFLQTKHWPAEGRGRTIWIADLFSGCGAMSLGIWEACRALGLRMKVRLAVDIDGYAAQTYKLNYPAANVVCSDVDNLLDGELGHARTRNECRLARFLGALDLACGGPPCQGNSDLNNWTRRNDPKNGLYARMARLAEVARPRNLIVENVPAVCHDKSRVVERTCDRLTKAGYNVSHAVIELSRLGLPQSRKRHVLVASLEHDIDLEAECKRFSTDTRTVEWAIGDLRDLKSISPLDLPTKMASDTITRIEYLFNSGIYDLPDDKRPDCHRLKAHSYKSVYGRMRWHDPAQTITSGFTCMGQGRFVHPSKRRTITPHEAARLQFIPDFFQFPEGTPRTIIARLIGNAVPPRLSYILALAVLR